MFKIYPSFGYDGYCRPFVNSGMFKIVDTLTEADLLLLAGGEDINPAIYKAKKAPQTHSANLVRDEVELADIAYALDNGIPMFGTCRGMQMLTAIAGGELIQHVDKHAGSNHNIVTDTGQIMKVNSLHHQMCDPTFVINHEVLAWSIDHASTVYIGETGAARQPYFDIVDQQYKEPEIVWYPDIKGLGVQFHPEMMHHSSDAVQHVMDLVEEKLIPLFSKQ